MLGLKVGGYEVSALLYHDANVIYARGHAPTGDQDVLLAFLGDRLDEGDSRARARGAPSPTEPLPAMPGPIELEFVPVGPEAGHKNLLPLIGFGRVEGWTVLAYPFVNALPLSVQLRQVPNLKRRDALKFVLLVADAVRTLHKVSLISTDITLANVFVDDQSSLHLAYHRSLGPERHRDVFKANPQQKRYEAVAPEQVWGNGPGRGTDVFQLGALLATLLTRRLLVLPPNVAKMDFQAAMKGLYPPEDWYSGLPRGVDEVVRRALRPEPPDRYESVDELRSELKSVYTKLRITDAVSDVIGQNVVKRALEFTRGRQAAEEVEEPEKEQQEEREEAAGVAPAVVTGRGRVRDARDTAPPRSIVPAKAKGGKPPPKTAAPPPWLERLGPHGVPALLGVLAVVLVAVPFVFRGSADGPAPPPTPTSTTRPGPPVRIPTRGPEVQTVVPTAVPGQEGVIDFTDLTPTLNQARARPTDESSFPERKKFLQTCYLRLPREHRGKAIPSSIFQQLFEARSKDEKMAWRLVDETFEKFESYLRAHSARM